jgi:transposase
MLKVEGVMDIHELHRAGHSVREISRVTGCSRNTVKRVLGGEHSLKRKRVELSSKLDAFKPYLKERYEAHGLSAVRLIEEIAPMGYTGSVDTLRRYLRTLRTEVTRKRKVTVRFETPPGKQAQADWTYCGKHPMPDGRMIQIYAFVMVLGFSRQLFVHFTTSMRMPELIRCHQLAFEFFGGWTATILYDNMKQVKLSQSHWNEQFLDFANHYGFTAKTHRPYRPRTKGKVERVVDYVKDNFLLGRGFEGIDDLNAQALHWLNHTANVRVHATTNRQPCELFLQETLTPLSSVPAYSYIDPVKRTVSWESMVRFEGSRYSVPPAFAGKSVVVSSVGGVVVVRADDMVITEHAKAATSGQCIVHKEHLAELWKITEEQTRQPERSKWHLSFTQTVQQASLAQFEQVAS